jgi:hypothetical protein
MFKTPSKAALKFFLVRAKSEFQRIGKEKCFAKLKYGTETQFGGLGTVMISGVTTPSSKRLTEPGPSFQIHFTVVTGIWKNLMLDPRNKIEFA